MIRSILASLSAVALLIPVAASPAEAAQAAAAAAPAIPCPKPKVAPPAGVPARPVPPADDPVGFAIGGDALATHGLVIPAGVKQPPAVTATTWMVADLDTGEVLGGCGPHVYQTPASVQKTLLAATAIGKLDPKKQITVTADDLKIEPGSSAVGLVVGGKYTISTLWLGLLLNSGNDAANALARLAGGGGKDGVAKTVAAMNDTARRLGAFQTHAVTPSGLDGKGQFTSAYDLALIARVCFANADFRKYALTKVAQMPAQPALKKGGFQFQNENKLIYKYPGALGGKTGFTQLARHSYVGAAQRNGRRLVVTLLGAEARPQRGYDQGAALLDWGFSLPDDASVGKLVTPEETAAKSAAPSPIPEPATTGNQAAAAADTRPTSPQLLSVAAAASVALLLAATPLLLLLTQRRRTRKPRKSRQ
ncbi:D-alanyl-D-alanine carboxypeptidase (penicillin-binding protein 5/6) [Paractinoplanes atraurantiacus]|uniref:D-alanyl-D-alanine carboxypeptidase (Penicillin-binding protein 5/6) n=1 Tax=Paractinoplanes atraurantiacus TaxID=1036182 RepID=A0A285JMK2_9ACTN|nr:D-alanyl-D-alanine carboxypeptidase (penicillin-binding protein 5/6) [Actinoplanes atraurantiacus]